MDKVDREFYMKAFCDDMEALSLCEMKWGIKFSDMYDGIRNGTISNNTFQCMTVDFVNLCRRFWKQED